MNYIQLNWKLHDRGQIWTLRETLHLLGVRATPWPSQLEKYKLETPWPWLNLDITRNSPPVTLRATPWRSHLSHCRQVGNKCPSPTGQASRIAELTRKTFLQIAAYFTHLNGALHKFLSLCLYFSFNNKICNQFYPNQEDISWNCSIFYIFEWGSP